MRKLVAILILLLGIGGSALARELPSPPRVWVLPESTEVSGPTPDQAIVRDLGDFRLVILPPAAGDSGLDPAQEMVGRPGEILYLVENDRLPEAPKLADLGRVLHRGRRLALIAVDAGHVPDLDRLGVCKERLIWLPRVERAAHRRAEGTLEKAVSVDPAVKQAIADAVDPGRYAQIVRELSGDLTFSLDGSTQSIHDRYSYTSGSGENIDIAKNYLVDRFEAAGYQGSHLILQPFSVGATTTWNIIAVKEGAVYPDSVVVVGAHYDSISEIPTVLAPGSEDNASGVAAVLHLAEIFTGYQTERTVHFVCFSGEEQGLYGSQYYVSQLGANGWNVTQSLIMDMISSWQTHYQVVIEGDEPWAGLMGIFADNVTQHAQIGYREDWYSWGSDHVPFQSAGIPCFLAIDLDYPIYPHYHRSTDEYSWVDPTLGVRITKAIGTTLADLSKPVLLTTGDPPLVSRRLSLGQNLPNPFNPSTRIDYEIPESGLVRLEIFDVAGHRVRRLVDGDESAGPHSVTWNGRDGDGRRVASGVYLYRLWHESGEISRRMILAK